MRQTTLIAIIVLVTACSAGAQTMETFVAADDGTLLATDVYLPEGNPPWPTLLVRTPYGKRGEAIGDGFAALGYVAVIQDTRGRSASGGIDTVFRDDGDDGRATLRWILEQSWSDGRVGTYGGSALGITQYMLSPAAGPGLRCTVPVVATPDIYGHAMIQGGALREALAVNWLTAQGSLFFLDEVRQHRLYDQWWDEKAVLPRAAEVTAAGLHMGGWYDIFAQGTIDAFHTFQHAGGEGAAGEQVLLMGPWTHGSETVAGELVYPENSQIDIHLLMLQWFDWCVRDLDTGAADWPRAYVYLMGDVDDPGAHGNEWIALPDWPPPFVERSYHLTGDGSLQVASPPEGRLTMVSDPADPVPTLGGANLHPWLEVDGRPMGAGPFDQRPVEARDDVLVFSTPPLAEPVTVMGPVTVSLWVQPDTPDFDVAVRLTDVYPDGRSMLVVDGIRRARSRCGADRECLATPGEPVRLDVDLWSTALVFNAGHRIRISVSGSNAPRFEVNPNHGGVLDGGPAPVVARPEILVGPQTPSRLILPVVPAPRLPSGRSG
jgi:predicted acyl esterase